jgi:hypothetical protein
VPSFVRLGDQNLDPNFNDGADPVDYNIKKMFKHPNFVRDTMQNDIALIKLEKDVNFTKHIRPACLEQTFFAGNLHKQHTVVAVSKSIIALNFIQNFCC